MTVSAVSGRLLVLLVLCTIGAVSYVYADGYSVKLPPGFPQDVYEGAIPADNPMSADKVALGRKLFFEKRLSLDNTVSCATCHDPKFGFTDGKSVSEGVGQKKGPRNAPTVLNAMFNSEQFWDGRAASLELQATGPLVNPIEMAMPSLDAVVDRLNKMPEYPPMFQKAFNGPPTIERLAAAISCFERTLISLDAPFDRFVAGDATAISPAAQRGFELFKGKARCITCHAYNPSSPFFTDFKYHNIGIGMKASANFAPLARALEQQVADGTLTPQSLDKLSLSPGYSELGRFLVTRQPRDLGAFKTPGLRDLALTGPYMHDGSEKTLHDVLLFYNKGGEPNPNLDGGMIVLNLSEAEMSDIEEFLKSLNGDHAQRMARGQEAP